MQSLGFDPSNSGFSESKKKVLWKKLLINFHKIWLPLQLIELYKIIFFKTAFFKFKDVAFQGFRRYLEKEL